MRVRALSFTRLAVVLVTSACLLAPSTLPAQRVVPAGPTPWPVTARTAAPQSTGPSAQAPAVPVGSRCRVQSALLLGAIAFVGVEGLELAYVAAAAPIRVLLRPHLWMPDPAWGYYAAAGAAIYGAIRPLPRCRGG